MVCTRAALLLVLVDAYQLPASRLAPAPRRFVSRGGAARLQVGKEAEVGGPSAARVWSVAMAAVVGIGSSAVLARGVSGEAAPLAIAFWRMVGSSSLLACAPAVRSGLRRIAPRDACLAVAAGAFLAAHFQLFFLSLVRTTILRSTVLVGLVPLWAGLADRFVLGNEVAPSFWPGVAAAVGGAYVMAASANPVAAAVPTGFVSGDALALAAGVVWAANMLLSRSARQRISAPTWQAAVCASAGGLLFLAAAVGRVPLVGFSPRATGTLVLFVLGPQLVGHQGLDYVIKYLPAPTVAALTLLEPVVASVLAALFLSEYPTTRAAVGALVATVGVGLAL